jgi:hypothetical protein
MLATFYIMNTTRNGNRWGVSNKSLEEALPSILGKPLGLGQGYVTGHQGKGWEGDPLDVAEWVATEKPNGYALAKAQFNDEKAYQMLIDGELGPISVVIDSYSDRCSFCGEELSGTNPYEHEHIKKGEGYIVVDSFTFVRVDFVDNPAYPQANLLKLGAYDNNIVPIEAIAQYSAGLNISQSNMDQSQGTGSDDQNPMEKGKNTMSEELKAQFDQLQKDYNELKAKHEATEEENTTLRSRVDKIEAERKEEVLVSTLKARFEAGISKDMEKDREELAGFPVETLKKFKADADLINASKPKPSGTTIPKVRYSNEDTDPLKKAMSDMRNKLGLKLEAS